MTALHHEKNKGGMFSGSRETRISKHNFQVFKETRGVARIFGLGGDNFG